jgi:SAM-dependent methyltransferase
LLNVGCGDRHHPAWTNLDLRAHDPSVMACDIREALPFASDTFDAVYHSHVLEHLTPQEGQRLMAECWRVLRPGGLLRVVIPDLETIATLYLEKLRRADAKRADSVANYEWMKLELLDQMVRDRSGGLMGEYMSDPTIVNSKFVQARIGTEFSRSQMECGPGKWKAQFSFDRKRWRAAGRPLRERLARNLVRMLLGPAGARALMTGLFRDSGEVHRWMYDRFSLNQICDSVGFTNFRIRGPESSSIPNFASYGLDTAGGSVSKPDSLFCECSKPATAAAAHAAA